MRSLALAALAALTPAVHAELVRHDFFLMLEYTDGAGAVSSFTLEFSDTQFVEFETRDGPGGVASNPLYEQSGVRGENPLFGDDNRTTPGTPSWVESFRIDVGAVTHFHREGIIHRDIAARNVLISTSTGLFEADLDLLPEPAFRSMAAMPALPATMMCRSRLLRSPRSRARAAR